MHYKLLITMMLKLVNFYHDYGYTNVDDGEYAQFVLLTSLGRSGLIDIKIVAYISEEVLNIMLLSLISSYYHGDIVTIIKSPKTAVINIT